MTETPGEEGLDAERRVQAEGLADPADDPQTRPAEDAERAVEEEAVRENAETSLDQPSEDVS